MGWPPPPTSLLQVEVDQETVLDCAESIMEALDNDGDGEITKDEFTEHAGKNEFLENLLKWFLNQKFGIIERDQAYYNNNKNFENAL